MSILNKMKQANISVGLSTEDQNFCENEYKDFKITHNKLTELYNMYFKLNEDTVHVGYHKITTYLDLTDFHEKIGSIEYNFVTTICSFFRKKYKIKIDSSDYQKEFSTNILLKDLTDKILLDFGDLYETGKQTIYEAYRKKVCYKNRFTVVGNTIKIKNILSFDYYDISYGEYNLPYSSDVNESFAECIKLIFDEDILLYIPNTTYKGNKAVRFEIYEFPDDSVLKYMKFFKNGSIKIAFHNQQNLQKFISELKLNDLENSMR